MSVPCRTVHSNLSASGFHECMMYFAFFALMFADLCLGLVGDFGSTCWCKQYCMLVQCLCMLHWYVTTHCCISHTSLSFCLPHCSLVPFLFLFFLCTPQNADRLYKGQLSEFTPLSSIHTPPVHKRGGDEDQSHTHRRSDSSPRKKVMYTRWGGGPDYCTFRPFFRFGGNPRLSGMGYAYAAPGPETSI